jgi:hypothetical protein
MTTVQTAIRFIRLSFVAPLFCAGLLIAFASAGSAAEIVPTAVSATAPQARDARQAGTDSTSAAPQPAQITLPLTGATGFGWG